jgi:hypothetical protein
MHPSDTDIPSFEIDERYLRDWVAFGMGEIQAYLTRHARFAAWCDERDRLDGAV